MEIPVLVEAVPGVGFRARAGDPFSLCAEATTQPEALEKLRKLIDDRHKAGAWIVHLDIGNIDSPTIQTFGTLDPDDPLTKEWEAEMAEYRNERNKELEEL